MGFLLEFMAVIYLSSKNSFQLILVSYATMACLGNFDTLYSQSLQEHPCREIIGKKICTVWRRCMYWHKDEMIEALKEEQMKREDAVATDKEVAGEKDEMAKDKKKEEKKANKNTSFTYNADRVVGNGSFGVVFQATVAETGEDVAIKKVY